jgi:5-methylcytosine-specific restriction protein A
MFILQREPLCRYCYEVGRIEPANEVDHIDGNYNNNDVANLQALCKVCHSRKTAQEKLNDGRAHSPRSDTPYYRRSYDGNKWRPKILTPAIPVTVVCGPPGAGKTSYVERHRQSDDIVIDLDQIKVAMVALKPVPEQIDITSLGDHARKYMAITAQHGDVLLADEAIVQRNNMLRALAHEQDKQAWFIVCAPLASERKWWKAQLKARVIVMQTSPGEAERRIRADTFRGDPDLRVSWMRSWWARYVFDSATDDEVIAS